MLTKEEYSQLHTQLCLMCLAFNQVTEIIERFVEKPKRKLEIGEIYLNDAGEICKIEAFYVDNELNTLAKIQGAKSGGYLVSGKESFRYAHRLILDKRYKLVEITDGE